ncbi:MAG: nickel pincer cofactor biosynthesis protein LarB [Deltaproteobacteria bacterium]|nr:nickel pincer cofactor biosynthesis protein LarB [Deltaproteobacteria bacterium]
MDASQLRRLLEQLKDGSITVDEAFEGVKHAPYANLGFAQVDHHRALRQGLAEVILGEPKTAEQIAGIAGELVRASQNVLVTRLDATKAAAVQSLLPELRYVAQARVGTIEVSPIPPRPGCVLVITGGTGDIPVAEEAVETLRMSGVAAQRLYDVGVAGIHRVLALRESIEKADAAIVVAGMEGALASVVGGLASCPVIAVPTSVGYGAQLAGFTPLFSMLSSCASGVVVVNIDNGFGAAMAVHRLLLTSARAKKG